MHARDRLPFSVVDLENAGAGEVAGARHHDVEAAEGRHRRLDDLVRRGEFGNAGRARRRATAGRDDLVRRLLGGRDAVLVDEEVVDDDRRATTAEFERDGPTQTSTGTGDDGDLAVEVDLRIHRHHHSLPTLVSGARKSATFAADGAWAKSMTTLAFSMINGIVYRPMLEPPQ